MFHMKRLDDGTLLRSPDEAQRNPGPLSPPQTPPRISLRSIRATLPRVSRETGLPDCPPQG